MALSTVELVGFLGEHLNTDAGILAQVGEDAIIHANAPEDQACPFVLYAMPRINLRDSQGIGPATASGQTCTATIVLSVITEADDPSELGAMAHAADAALRSWSPSGWSMLEVEAVEERTDSHVAEGERLQSATLQYRVILVRD